jgi:2',3'-cyclic-nucleotide 2'-phosphodiesterase/3'-nucleotidase
MGVGTHEFNYGLDTLNRWNSQLTFPLLSANTRTTAGGEAFQPYVIKDVNGVKVGVLGLTTPAIPKRTQGSSMSRASRPTRS